MHNQDAFAGVALKQLPASERLLENTGRFRCVAPVVSTPLVNAMGAEMRDGDWICSSCGNHNFASRAMCNKCASSKPGGGAPVPSRAPEGGSGACSGGGSNATMRDGDWLCKACGNHNYASRQQCNKCSGPRDDGNAAPQRGGGNNASFRPGDWNCHNCGNHNFASRAACNKCGEPKMNGCGMGGKGAYGPSQFQQAMMPGADRFNPYGACGGGYGGYGGYAAYTGCAGCFPQGGCAPAFGCFPHMAAMAAAGPGMRPGDWQCPSCNNINYASRQECNKCGRPKMAPQNFRSGDWICSKCNNHNFASRESCNKCGAPKTAA